MDPKCVLTITTALCCLPLASSMCNDPKCSVCNSGGNNCVECVNGFTVNGSSCTPCPTKCLTCTPDEFCHSCSPGFWGYQCAYDCPVNCDESGCDKTTSYCFKCETGWYGPHCQQECNRCENDRCDSLKCSTGCKDGYVQEIYTNVSHCLQCPPFCKKCSNSTFCTECYSGHYIYQYSVEASIKVATCLKCSLPFPKCVDCTFDQNQVTCGSCEAGYVVNQDRNQCVTTVTCIHCQNGCDSEGLCFGGCPPGWAGLRCDYACSNSCETCINQDACLSCKDGFYTQMCNVPCNNNCQSGKNPKCRFGDGYCTNGCNKGFWGDQCEYNCNNNCFDIATTSELCHRNGTCYYRCKEGYMGSDCSQVSSTSPSLFSSTTSLRKSTDKTATSSTQTKTDVNAATEAYLQTVSDFQGSLGPAIGGSIAGGFVLGILASAVIFFLRKRLLRKQKDRAQSKNVYYNVSMSTSHEERSQSDTDRHLDRIDIELASASRQSGATLYEMLSEQNKGNLYDHLEQPSESEIRQEVGKLGSHAGYYNN